RRPLLKAEDLETRVRQLMRDREQAYLRAGVAVYTDGRSLQQLCDIVGRVYDREARSFSRRKLEG
ncbi:MAG: shikimate kinase, partial [Opitutia bacterium]